EGPYREWYPDADVKKFTYFKDTGGTAPRTKESTGRLKLASNFKDGQLNGKLMQWFPDGVQQSESNYVKGQLEGPVTQWFDQPEHRFAVAANYKNGMIEGVQTIWYESGRKKQELTLIGGQRQGPWAEWYDRDQPGATVQQVKTKGEYKDDQLNGPIWSYYEDG